MKFDKLCNGRTTKRIKGMELQECNRTIAEFMGLEITEDQNGNLCEWVESCSFGYPLKYHNSLDALVPVWRTLELFPRFRMSSPAFDVKKSAIECALLDAKLYQKSVGYSENLLYAEAAAIATAKAIKELGK